ncbi:MAG: FHA domain-containing protein [Clostridiales bacterium]|nr:FHA domain-containing protein [Clostridiales bacterium]
MALVQCDLGHYYDNSRFGECPMCKKLAQSDRGFGIQSQITVSGYKIGEGSNGITELLGEHEMPEDAVPQVEASYDAMSDENSTIGFFSLAGAADLTVGWLVVTDGEERGKSYTLFTGRNRCGSGSSNDVVIDDRGAAAERHCSITYEPKENKFFLAPENGAVFCNDKFISEPILLKSGDKIHIGKTDLVFVPFCTENRRWSE